METGAMSPKRESPVGRRILLSQVSALSFTISINVARSKGAQRMQADVSTAFYGDDLERAILGAILINPALLEVITPILAPEHFSLMRHQLCYIAMQEVYLIDDTISPLVLRAH